MLHHIVAALGGSFIFSLIRSVDQGPFPQRMNSINLVGQKILNNPTSVSFVICGLKSEAS